MLKQLRVVSLQEAEQRREKEEDAREQARLQAEQERLKQQFAEEKEAEKAKRAAESGVSLLRHNPKQTAISALKSLQICLRPEACP